MHTQSIHIDTLVDALLCMYTCIDAFVICTHAWKQTDRPPIFQLQHAWLITVVPSMTSTPSCNIFCARSRAAFDFSCGAVLFCSSSVSIQKWHKHTIGWNRPECVCFQVRTRMYSITRIRSCRKCSRCSVRVDGGCFISHLLMSASFQGNLISRQMHQDCLTYMNSTNKIQATPLRFSGQHLSCPWCWLLAAFCDWLPF